MPTKSTTEQVERAPVRWAALDAIGWSPERYRALNPDLVSFGNDELVRHYLVHGILENRAFGEGGPGSRADLQVDRFVISENLMVVYGWASDEVDELMLLSLGGGQILTDALIGATLPYWRADVATHLGIQPKTVRHGFVCLFELPAAFDRRSEFVVCMAGRAKHLVGGARATDDAAALLEVYRHIDALHVYDEIESLLTQAPAFMEVLGRAHEGALAPTPVHTLYDSSCCSSPRVTICAVALGNAAQLKVWMMAMSRQLPMDDVEVVVLANGLAEIDGLKQCCQWFGEVLGHQIRLLVAASNIGFNLGVNRVVEEARAPWVMVTNTDVRYKSCDWDALAEQASQDTIVAGRQFNSAGAIQADGLQIRRTPKVVHGHFYRAVSSALIGRNTFEAEVPSGPHEVEFFAAAAFFASKKVLQDLGPFSGRFLYAYHEDTDLSLRARKLGYRLLVSPQLQLVHYESSAANVDLPKAFLIAANAVRISFDLDH